jgi:hypothetical protein
MGKGGQTSTTKEELPPHVVEAQKHLINTGQRLTDPFTQNAPAYAVAGLTPDQKMGFDLTRGMAETAFNTPTQRLSGMAAQAGGAAGRAAQLAPGEIQDFMNPYNQAVIGTTLGNMRRERDNASAGIAARYAGQAGLGGSGEALARGQLNRGFGEQVASTVANLMSQGFDRASALAMANAQMRQQANMANAQMAQQNNQFNAGAQNAMAVQTAQTNSAMLNDEQTRQMRAIQQLLQGGQAQQVQAQAGIDVPFTMLQRLIGTTPSLNNTGGTKTTETSGGGGAGIAQAGLGLLSLFLSDEGEKKDVKKLGNDPQTGLPLYSYNYKDDPKSAPKRVGPMAQDIEKVNPGAVMNVGGKKVVRG